MAKIPFLKSKLSVPPLNRRHIARPRLVETLDNHLSQGSRLVFLSAPAGYGKTTLLSEWVHTSSYIREQNIQVRWISFEKEEVDFQRFAFLVMAALVTDPNQLSDFVDQFEQAPGQQEWLEILSDVVESVNEEHIVLILDDFPWTSETCLQTLLHGISGELQIIISSRLRPASWIVGFLLKWRVAEIGQQELRFEEHEIQAFLEGETRNKVSLKTSAQFVRRTEGWAVALQLATWRIHLGANPQEVVKNLRGDEDLLLDYLMDEVYQKQTPEHQRFLRQTSILRHLNPQLCDAIRQSTDSAACLHDLFNANVFLSAVDENRHWYRYHNLFAGFLHKRLIEDDGQDEEKRLHTLASEWYSQQPNATREAARHALLAGDYQHVVRLLETGTYDDIMTTSYPLVIDLLHRVPVETFLNSPWLCILTTWVFTLLESTINGKSSKEWLEIAKAGLEKKIKASPPGDHTSQALQAEIEILEAFVTSSLLSDPLESIKEKTSLHFLAEMAYCLHLSTKQKILGKDREVFETLENGFIYSRLKGNTVFAQLIKCLLIFYNLRNGLLLRAEQLLAEPEEWLDSSDSLFSLRSQVQIFKGLLALQKNELDTALQYTDQVLESFNALNLYEKFIASVFLAQYFMTVRDWQKAHQVLVGARSLSQDFTSSNYIGYINHLDCLLDFKQGFLDRVRHHLDLPIQTETSLHKDLHQKRLLMSCRYQLTLAEQDNRFDSSRFLQNLELLDQRLTEIDKEFNPASWMEVLIMKSLLLQRLGNLAEAEQEMSRAVKMGAPSGYQLLFLEEGAPVMKLLTRLFHKKIEPAFCKVILNSFAASSSSPISDPLPEMEAAITRREREMLYYLAKGESNQEIATRLCISLATVKKHLANLYRKLGVTSRRQAVQHAREKGWIKEIHLKG